MSRTQSGTLADRLSTEFFRRYYKQEILQLAQRYPNEQRTLEIDWTDVYKFDPDVADDYLGQPEEMRRYFEEALRLYDLSVDVSLGGAHVRIYNLPEEFTFYPGSFSPSKHMGVYRGIRGEIVKLSDVYPKIEEAAFECQLCGTLNRIPQSTRKFQEPHECQGCERQGPFNVNYDQSEFIDAQKLRIKIPPELSDGAGQKIDALVEDDICDQVTIGDRVIVSGIVRLEQDESNNKTSPKFEPYLEGHHIEIEQTDQQDIDVSSEERKQIESYAAGELGDPIEIGAQSLSVKVWGFDDEKKALLLALASGGKIEYSDGDSDRSNLNVLLIGDPGTAKSKLIDRAEDIGWRTVGVSSKRATIAGLTVTAEQDDFSDGEWSLKAGAFVKANGGTVCIDELDDMDPKVRSAMLEPMSKQRFNASLAGEQATFYTEAAVVTAANPKHGRFDPYEPVAEQFDFDSALLSRFDLIFTVRDVPDQDDDRELSGHILDVRDAAKRGEDDDAGQGEDATDPIVEPEMLRKWIAVAKQQPAPPFESSAVKEQLQEGFLSIRRLYDLGDDSPIPVTMRDLEGLVRVAEAAAKFELSPTIKERHARIATELAGRSMEDVGRNEDGEFDADVVEVGQSKSQTDRIKTLKKAIVEVSKQYDNGAPREEVIEHVQEDLDRDYDSGRLHTDMDAFLEDGEATEPQTDHIRYLGRVV